MIFNSKLVKLLSKFEKMIEKANLIDFKEFLPQDLPLLSKGADTTHLHGIFSKQQLKELGLLKKIILKIKDKKLRDNLLLAFSSTLTKTNINLSQL